jgi:hypothetical protein
MYELSFLDIYNKNSTEILNYINNMIEQLEEEKKCDRYKDEPNIIKSIEDTMLMLKTTFNVRLNVYETESELINIDNINNLINVSKELNLPFKLFISGSSYTNDDPINNIHLLFTDECIERFKVIDEYISDRIGINLRFSEETYNFDNTWSLDDIITANDSVNSVVEFIVNQNLSPFEAIAFIHKITAVTFEYNEAEEAGMNSRNLIGILNTDEIVCVGYAVFVKAICDKLNMSGLSCENYTCFLDREDNLSKDFEDMYFRTGEAHMQNLIKINDNKYNVSGAYVLDSCWDSKSPSFPNGKGFAHFLYPVTDLLCLNGQKFIQHKDALDDVFCMIFECDDLHEESPVIVNNKDNSKPISINQIYDCLFNLYKVIYTKSNEEEIGLRVNRTLEVSKYVSKMSFNSNAINAIRQEVLKEDELV